MTQFASHSQNVHVIQLPRENRWSLLTKTEYVISFHSTDFRFYVQLRVNAAKISSKHIFPPLKLDGSGIYVSEHQFISPKQINLFVAWDNLSQMHSQNAFICPNSHSSSHFLFYAFPWPRKIISLRCWLKVRQSWPKLTFVPSPTENDWH